MSNCHLDSRIINALISFGYPLSFLERQRFLQILHAHLNDKHRIHTGKKVCRIEDDGPRAIVHTSDNSKYEADLVIGADGVHSIVRSEIWRHSNDQIPGIITEKERSSKATANKLRTTLTLKSLGLVLQYACIYGISLGVPFVEAGVQQSLLDDNLTIHIFVGIEAKVFWFAIVKISQERWSQNRRFTSAEAHELCEGWKSKSIGPNLLFGDIWSRQSIFKMTPLEEGSFNHWHHGRLVCMGDSVRKVLRIFSCIC